LALPAALAVRDYWQSTGSGGCEPERWEAEPVTLRLPDLRRYRGPGDLYVTVTRAAARIHTGGRWRGFLDIEPLRGVHLAAFRAIARALGSATMAICADSRDDVYDEFAANGSPQQCVARMRSAMGPPQPSVDAIAPDVVARAEHGVPDVWFLDPPIKSALVYAVPPCQTVTLRWTDDGRPICPVCDNIPPAGAEAAWETNGGEVAANGLPVVYPSYGICSRCHTQFGEDDMPGPGETLTEIWGTLRERWLAAQPEG
jgi:hypothetical protein